MSSSLFLFSFLPTAISSVSFLHCGIPEAWYCHLFLFLGLSLYYGLNCPLPLKLSEGLIPSTQNMTLFRNSIFVEVIS
jgi:hypothetical protein